MCTLRTAAVLLILASALSVQTNATTSRATPQTCLTPECLALSALITSNINQSADPCDDFSAYACGHYHTNTLYDPTGLSWSRNDEPLMVQTGLGVIQKQLTKRLFELLIFQRPVSGEDPDVSVMYRLASSLCRSCTGWYRRRSQRGRPNSDLEASRIFLNGILEHLLDSIEGNGYGTPNGSFERSLAKMVRYDAWSMLRVGPSFRYRFQMSQNGTADRSIAKVTLSYGLWDLPNANATVDAYTSFFETLSAGAKIDFERPKEFFNIAHGLIQNVTLTIKKTCIDAADMKSRKTDFSIRELDSLSKCVDPVSPFSWLSFFEGVLDGRVDKDTLINTNSPNSAMELIHIVTYFKRLSPNTKGDKKYSIHFSFLIFDWLLSFYQFFPDALAAQWDRSPIKYRGLPVRLEGEDPLSDCMMLTKILLGPVVERMFQKTYHQANFDHVMEMIGLLQNATIKSVREAEWITPNSKDAIVDKIVSLKKDIGFEVVPLSSLKRFYASTIRAFSKVGYKASVRNFGILMSFAMCARAGRANNLLTDGESSSFAIPDTLTVNAFYSGKKNNIIFPMGILSPFLYHKSFPDYMNLGGIGVVIGHEIGHGFDNEGHELNKQGVQGHFWDNQTEQGYLQRVKCVSSRFSSYELVPGRPHNANTTVGNDIADLMGIRSAFNALQMLGERGRLVRLPNLPESLTPERLFFVQAAQAWCVKAEPSAISEMYAGSAHSPPHIRVQGMMENSREFARVFQCKGHQKMNPSNKCEFW